LRMLKFASSNIKPMNRKKFLPAAILLSLFSLLYLPGINAQNSGIPSPEKFFGFKPGTDRMLFTYETLIEYFQALDQASNRVKMLEIGQSPQGRKMYVVFISSEENIKNLENLKAINKQLALNAELSDNKRDELVREGKVFLMATLSMHSTEVGPAQASPLIAWQLVTSQDPSILKIRNDVVYMVVPTHNPDGMDMVVDNYNKNKGTRYERSSFPGVYHKYLGHDNNRDFNNLTQEDSRAVSRLYSTEWFPQVLTDKHQMGMTGPRYFVPPYHDPISENIDADLWNWIGIFGANLMRDMTKDGLAGVSNKNGFDNYWPGSTKTCLWKNVITFLTECASAYVATPAYIEPTELSVGGKGLSEYKMSTNMPKPWPGGWWRLGDIVSYEISSTFSALTTASSNRAEILKFRNDMGRRQVESGKTTPPYFYILPLKQHDPGELSSLINLLQEHGVNLFQLKNHHQFGNQVYDAGDIVIPLAQPYRAFIKEIMEKQYYPERHYSPGGLLVKPYDITSWSFPLHRGLVSFEINNRLTEIENDLALVRNPFRLAGQIPKNFTYVVLSSGYNESYKVVFSALTKKMKVQRTQTAWNKDGNVVPAGSFTLENNPELIKMLEISDISPLFMTKLPDVQMKEVILPRIGLIETWFSDVDAGWTRYLLDNYHVPFTVLRPGDIKNTNLTGSYDVLLFPDAGKSLLMDGKNRREDNSMVITEYPPEYTKGLTTEGLNKILDFLKRGGLIISWGRSTALFEGNLALKGDNNETEEFLLPFSNAAEALSKAGMYSPGSLARIELIADHPLTFGMLQEANIFFRGQGAFTTSPPVFDMDRRVIGKFPENDILQSGYMENEKLLTGKSAMVWIQKGDGQLVLMAFSPAFRASTQGAYKLLFNSILLKL
jgi:hypothetical protein